MTVCSKLYTWQQIPSTLVSDILSEQFDGIVLDLEHGCFNKETMYACIQLITAKNKECFIRLNEISPNWIRWILDAGVTGIIFSTIEKLSQIDEIKKLCFYPQDEGKRGLGLVRNNKWGQTNLLTNSKPKLIAQIETKAGLDLIKLKRFSFDFDYYLIGPYDLSASLGDPGNFESYEFKNALASLEYILGKKKLGIHIPNNVVQEKKKYLDYGFLALGMDTIMLVESSLGML